MHVTSVINNNNIIPEQIPSESYYLCLQVKSRNRLPEELKYQQMRWECKHFGVFKSRGNNKREYECALANDCKFQISVTYNRLLGKFIVTTAVLDHDTHEVSESLYQLYSSHRKLSVEQKKEIDSMLLANAKPTLVAEVLTKEGMSVCMKDLYNRKQKLLKIGNDIDDAVLSALNHPHIISRRITDINNKFEVLFFQTYTQRKLFANFGEVIHIHAFKTYNLKFPLYTLLVVDNNGIDQPIAFGILVKEKPQHIANFLEIFKGLNDVSNVQCVIVDKELAEIDALTKSLPAKCVHICYFHILKAVDNHLSTLKLENEGECRKQFDLVLKSRNEDEFARKLNELAFLSPEFHSYVVQNWLPFKEKITLFGCKDLMHLQNRTDNRIESFHDILKQVTATSGITLNVLIENLLSLVAERAYESVQQNIDMGTKEAESTNSDLENYYRQFTDYAASLIGKEMDLASSKTYRILPSSDGKLLIRNVETQAIHEISGDRCSCNLPSNFGIPCHHLIATWRLTGETLFQPNYVANR